MKLNSKIYDIVNSGFYIGENKPCGRVTIEPDWVLQSTDPIYDGSVRGPFRYWQDSANDQIEYEVPNIQTIQIERSLSQDIATCNITLYNQWHDANSGSTVLMTPELNYQLGKPGFFWPKRGESLESQIRWNQESGKGAYRKDGSYDPDFDWANVIVPNALIRTYQGYGGNSDSVQDALDNENIMLTGAWLIDSISAGTDGMLSVQCRDIGRLLLEQIVYPPLVPQQLYPLEYRTGGKSAFDSPFGPSPRGVVNGSFGEVRALYTNSSTDVIFGLANHSIFGHRGSHASDGNANTYAISPAVDDPVDSNGYFWWEFDVEKPGGSGRLIQGLNFTTWGGGYTAYISVYYNGTWFGNEVVPGGVNPVPYVKMHRVPLMPPDGNEREQNVDIGIAVAADAVFTTQVGNGVGGYHAEKIRITLGAPLIYSGLADGSGNQYRSGLKDIVFRAVGRKASEFSTDPNELPWTFCMDSHPVRGYWVLERSGYVHGFGDAANYDSSAFGNVVVAQPPIVGVQGQTALYGPNMSYVPPSTIAMAAHPSGEGYWVLDITGRVYAFGAAQYKGQVLVDYRGETFPLLGPGAIDIAPTHTGNGYWVLYSHGIVHGFGDAPGATYNPGAGVTRSGRTIRNTQWEWRDSYPSVYQTSLTATSLSMINSGVPYTYWYYDNNPLGFLVGAVGSQAYDWARRGTAIASHPRRMGFWVTDGSGQIWPFEDVEYHGGMSGRVYNPGSSDTFTLNYSHWPHGLASTKSGNGYWICFASGRIAAYGDAVKQGTSYIYEDHPQVNFQIPEDKINDWSFFRQLVWDITRDPDGQGFWVLLADGSVKSYNAQFWGNPGWWGKTGYRWNQGNFKEYVDIVKDMLCWSGFTFYDSSVNSVIDFPQGTILTPGTVYSIDDYKLIMQTDGNLVFGTGNIVNIGGTNTLENVIWNSTTSGNSGAVAIFQTDGNFVIYRDQVGPMSQWAHPSRAIWSSATDGRYDAKLIMRYDGYFGVMSPQGSDLWIGFPGAPDPVDRPSVFGNIESTGIYTDIELTGDKFDKRTVIDCINEIKQVVGYNFFIDQDGRARFESPNWWSAGNFDDDGVRIYVQYNEDGSYTRVNPEGATPPEGAELFIPEINETKTLKNYQVNLAGDSLRSEIIIGSDNPDPNNPKATSFVRFTPPSSSDEIRPGVPALRNIVRPALWIDNTFTNKEEQQLMAELINLQIWFSQRTGSVTCVGDPTIGINDQVKIIERNTSETFIHYIRGISSTMDLDTGRYEMTLTTNWLGNSDDWVITSDNVYNPITHVSITEKVDRWQRVTGRELQFSGLGQKPVILTGGFS